IKVAGNPKDCSGVLTCDFAVNARYRDVAELAVYKIGEQSQGCHLCATPNCIGGDLAYCEPISKRCIPIANLIGGIPVIGDQDAGRGPDASGGFDSGFSAGDGGVPESGVQ